jgi:hypothetical protein
MLRSELSSFGWIEGPLPASVKLAGQGHSLKKLVKHHLSMVTHDIILEGSMLKEQTNYALAAMFLPHWVAPSQYATASTLFLPKPPKSPSGGSGSARSPARILGPSLCAYELPWTARPELRVTVQHQQHPPFNGEVKSVISANEGPSPKLFDELVTYCTLAMVGSLFPNVSVDSRRYYREPPISYGLVGLAHVGYLVACQWVGKVFASVISQPFFLGSDEHEAEINGLQDLDYGPLCVDIDTSSVNVTMADDKKHRVLWTASPISDPLGSSSNSFFKLIQCDAYEAPYFRRLHAVYRKLRSESERHSDRPQSVVSATLLYGRGEIAIVMPFRGDRDARDDDLQAVGPAVNDVAAAIIWLAKRGLLYYDLRLPNVRIDSDSGNAFLVDYDDVLVVDTPPAAFAEFVDVLAREGSRAFPDRDHEGTYLSPPGCQRHMPAVAAAIAQLWTTV